MFKQTAQDQLTDLLSGKVRTILLVHGRAVHMQQGIDSGLLDEKVRPAGGFFKPDIGLGGGVQVPGECQHLDELLPVTGQNHHQGLGFQFKAQGQALPQSSPQALGALPKRVLEAQQFKCFACFALTQGSAQRSPFGFLVSPSQGRNLLVQRLGKFGVHWTPPEQDILGGQDSLSYREEQLTRVLVLEGARREIEINPPCGQAHPTSGEQSLQVQSPIRGQPDSLQCRLSTGGVVLRHARRR